MYNESINLSDLIVNSNFSKNQQLYQAGLILTSARKTNTAMGEQIGHSHDKLNRALDNGLESTKKCKAFLHDEIIRKIREEGHGYITADDTLVPKEYAELLPGLEYHFDSCSGETKKGVSIIIFGWSNGETFIPLDFKIYYARTIVEPDQYKTKIQLLQELIDDNIDVARLSKNIIIDGLYSSTDMLHFLNSRGITFFLRLPQNRSVSENPDTNFKKVSKSSARLFRNQKSKKSRMHLKGLPFTVNIIAQKRQKRNGEYITVYIVTNADLGPQQVIDTYKKRWCIEKFFRTSKQYLGLTECQSRLLEKQAAHLSFIMLAYTSLQKIRERFCLNSTEEVIKAIRSQNTKTYRSFNVI